MVAFPSGGLLSKVKLQEINTLYIFFISKGNYTFNVSYDVYHGSMYLWQNRAQSFFFINVVLHKCLNSFFN